MGQGAWDRDYDSITFLFILLNYIKHEFNWFVLFQLYSKKLKNEASYLTYY